MKKILKLLNDITEADQKLWSFTTMRLAVFILIFTIPLGIMLTVGGVHYSYLVAEYSIEAHRVWIIDVALASLTIALILFLALKEYESRMSETLKQKRTLNTQLEALINKKKK